MHEMWSSHRTWAVAARTGMASLFCFMLLAASGYAQRLTGRWAATGKTLDDGEQEKAILELTQTGSDLKGRLVELGCGVDVKGTVTGSHFELSGVGWDDQKPFLLGYLVNGEVHWTQWGGAFVAKP